MIILPLSHAFGVLRMNMAAVNGAPCVILPSFDPEHVLDAIRAWHPYESCFRDFTKKMIPANMTTAMATFTYNLELVVDIPNDASEIP